MVKVAESMVARMVEKIPKVRARARRIPLPNPLPKRINPIATAIAMVEIAPQSASPQRSTPVRRLLRFRRVIVVVHFGFGMIKTPVNHVAVRPRKVSNVLTNMWINPRRG